MNYIKCNLTFNFVMFASVRACVAECWLDCW